MKHFNRTNLAHKSAKFAHLVVVFELADVDHECCHIEKTNADFVAVLFHSKHVFWLVTLFLTLEGALSNHVADLPAHYFVQLWLSLHIIFFLLLYSGL
jgi:hypothetical protein